MIINSIYIKKIELTTILYLKELYKSGDPRKEGFEPRVLGGSRWVTGGSQVGHGWVTWGHRFGDPKKVGHMVGH